MNQHLRQMKTQKIGIVVILAIGISVMGWFYFQYQSSHPRTNDAYIQADTVNINARVSGQITRVEVGSYQAVRKNDVLLVLDDTDYKLAEQQALINLDEAKAKLAIIKARLSESQAEAVVRSQELTDAKRNDERIQELSRKEMVSKEKADHSTYSLNEAQATANAAQASVEAAKSEIAQANAQIRLAALQLSKAKLDLSYTRIIAPADGITGDVLAQPGDFTEAGATLFPIVVTDLNWVTANYKETDLAKIKPGMLARIQVDMYSHKTYQGVVQSVSPASGSSFSLIPAQNATGNWVKVTQRFPVRIRLLDKNVNQLLRLGSSAVVTIDTASTSSSQ